MNIKKNTKEYMKVHLKYTVWWLRLQLHFSNNDLNKYDKYVSALKNTTYPKCHLFFIFSHFNVEASLFLVSLL